MIEELLVSNEDQFKKSIENKIKRIYVPAYCAVYILHTTYDKNFIILNKNILRKLMKHNYDNYDIKFNNNNITFILRGK